MNLKISKAIEILEKQFGINEGGLLRHNRSARVAEARHILMFYCMEVLRLRYKETAYYIQRDRTTIRHGVNIVVRRLIDGDKGLERILECLR